MIHSLLRLVVGFFWSERGSGVGSGARPGAAAGDEGGEAPAGTAEAPTEYYTVSLADIAKMRREQRAEA